ncbi:MAG: hypothetical protein CMJ78_04675 [Planctomycetaceae bacterium]|nr:hypothetical protein [Planctomycetaceae bacterium]
MSNSPPNKKAKNAVFAVLALLLGSVIAFGIWTSIKPANNSIERGKELNQRAWDVTYEERGLPIPETGPRDGYWGERIEKKAPHPAVKWTEPTVQLAGILSIDQNGVQRYLPDGKPDSEVLVVGGSVAFGTYASGHDTTYFCQLGELLSKQGHRCQVSVFAAGAWKSIQDFTGVRYYTLQHSKPNVVVYLNGLNDLTNGSNAQTLFGEPTRTKDGSQWTYLYHEHDYRERVDLYLKNMSDAADFSKSQNQKMLVVLQPALFERSQLTDVEKELLEGSLLPHKSVDDLLQSYDAMRQGLQKLAKETHVHFLDASRIFEMETATTFTDIWHFSDVGHRILAETMLPAIDQILDNK